MNRRYNILAGVLLFAAASPLWGAESPDLDGVTMEVLRQNDPREITHDIQLPHAIEKQGERHTRPPATRRSRWSTSTRPASRCVPIRPTRT